MRDDRWTDDLRCKSFIHRGLYLLPLKTERETKDDLYLPISQPERRRKNRQKKRRNRGGRKNARTSKERSTEKERDTWIHFRRIVSCGYGDDLSSLCKESFSSKRDELEVPLNRDRKKETLSEDACVIRMRVTMCCLLLFSASIVESVPPTERP